jgi:hypothetical protein
VLIRGETGTGKGLAARFVHQLTLDGGALLFEFGGLTPIVEHDFIEVAQTATFNNGLISFDFIDGFIPQQGDEFAFLTAIGGIGGPLDFINDFPFFSVTGLADGFDFEVALRDDGIGSQQSLVLRTLNVGAFAQAVPEPGTWVLLITGLIGLALYRRRG